jgi:hypothetical protein
MEKKLEETKDILKLIGMPIKQQNDICAYSLLALSGIKPKSKWIGANNEWIRIHDILVFAKENYNKEYAENTRETIRKNCLHQFRDAAVVEDNGKSTNSPQYRYRLTDEFVKLLRMYGTKAWKLQLDSYINEYSTLIEKYKNKKSMKMIPVKINGADFKFSTGKHNQLQKAIIEEFAPRFAPNSVCLYVGDTTDKDLYKDEGMLKRLGFEITKHDKMPDVVLYKPDTDWVYFIEAVTSVGPMSPKRILELDDLTKNVTVGKVYVTAFLNIDTYKKFVKEIAWETEVWLADMPEHMIHLNGDRFMGPR